MEKEILTYDWTGTGLEYLQEAQLEQLLALSELQHWSTRKRVVFQPSNISKVYIILQGKVKLGRSLPEKREDYHRLAGPKDWVGDLALVAEDFPPFFATAAQPTTVLAIPVLSLRKAMITEPKLNMAILQYMTQHLRALQKRREAMLRQPTRLRILSFLCEYCQTYGEMNEGILTITAPLSHTDIGKFTGTSRQSVNALMSALRRENLLDYDQEEIRVSPDNLHQLVYLKQESGTNLPL